MNVALRMANESSVTWYVMLSFTAVNDYTNTYFSGRSDY